MRKTQNQKSKVQREPNLEELQTYQDSRPEPQVYFRTYSSSYSNLNGKESVYSQDLEYHNGEAYLTTSKDGKVNTKKISLEELEHLYHPDFLDLPSDTHRRKAIKTSPKKASPPKILLHDLAMTSKPTKNIKQRKH